MNNNYLSRVRVFPSVLCQHRGTLVAGCLKIPCALGKAGVTYCKQEEDNKTPLGCFHVLEGYYRADKMRRPQTGIKLRPLRPHDGWCDDVSSRHYNKPVVLPLDAHHENMWRSDHVYDVVIDIGQNRKPILRGRGSAIFLHLARAGYTPTRGCIAVDYASICRLLERIGPKTIIEIV